MKVGGRGRVSLTPKDVRGGEEVSVDGGGGDKGVVYSHPAVLVGGDAGVTAGQVAAVVAGQSNPLK